MAKREHRAAAALARRNPLWQGQMALLAAITLGLALPPELTVGPPWILPGCEAAVLACMVGMTPQAPDRESPRRRGLRLMLSGLVSAINVIALVLLIHSLLAGRTHNGRSLLVAGADLWLTGVLLFAIWFWEFDGDGPVRRARGDSGPLDFQFPQTERAEGGAWMPHFGDYLYLSLTNASTFGPADTLPLTSQAKLLMAIQTLASLMTMMIVLAYAINTLG